MLHITNGDVVANKIKSLELPGDILVWREMLIDGPLSAQLFEDDFLQMRAAYFEQTMGIPASFFVQGMQEQLRDLRNYAAHERIILWFEHDLFDQTILLCLLDWFSRQDLGSTRLQLISINQFPDIDDFRGMGQLSPAQLATLVGTEQDVSSEQLRLGSRAWQAYVSADPRAVEQLLAEDTSALPYLREALLCHLRRFPAATNGVSDLEQTILELLDQGIEQLIPLFDAASQTEPVYGFGDLQFWAYLERMRSGAAPLLHIDGLEHLPRFGTPPVDFKQWRVRLTETGQRVLSRDTDWLAQTDTNRWLGGYHLTGQPPVWRWEQRTHQLVCTETKNL